MLKDKVSILQIGYIVLGRLSRGSAHQITVQRRALTRRLGVRSICSSETFSEFPPVASDSISLFSSLRAASICGKVRHYKKRGDGSLGLTLNSRLLQAATRASWPRASSERPFTRSQLGDSGISLGRKVFLAIKD